MKITKYNKLIDTDTIITVASETEAYPKENMISEILIEATKIETDIIIDFGAVLTGKNTIVLKVSENITSIKIDGNLSNAWTSPIYTNNYSTKYSNYFIIDLDVWNFRYYRITPTGTGDKFLNWVYFGENIEFPNMDVGSFKEIKKNNITNESGGGQIFTTAGVPHYEQTINFSNVSKTDYEIILEWYMSIYSAYNQLFYIYDDRLDEYTPYYCSILDLTPLSRYKDYYDFKIKIREAK